MPGIKVQFPGVGTREIPSVTEIIGLALNKPELVSWQLKLGKVEADKVRDSKATIGTKVHHEAEALLAGEDIIHTPHNASLRKWWENEGSNIEVVAQERQMVAFKPELFAGKMDLLYRTNGELHIGDIKTGSSIQDAYFIQMGAYSWAYREMTGESIDALTTIHVPQEPKTRKMYAVRTTYNVDRYEQHFLNLLDLFYHFFKVGHQWWT